MWARIARFEGDPETLDGRVERVRELVETGGLPPAVADAKLLMLVDRESGSALAITLFETEEALRAGDEALNAGGGRAGARSGVEFYEVPLAKL